MLKKVNSKTIIRIFVVAFALAIVITSFLFFYQTLFANPDEQQITEKSDAKDNSGMAYIASAIAVSGACIGAGFAVSSVGAAAMGAVAEKPELMGRSLLYVGLAEGIAIYGLIVAIIILGKV